MYVYLVNITHILYIYDYYRMYFKFHSNNGDSMNKDQSTHHDIGLTSCSEVRSLPAQGAAGVPQARAEFGARLEIAHLTIKRIRISM